MHVLLGAEAAADVGLDDAHVSPGDAQRLADDAAHDVRDLRGRDTHDLVVLHVAVGGAGLDVHLGLLTALHVEAHVVVGRVVDGVLHGGVAEGGQLVVGGHREGVGHQVVGLAVLHGVLRAALCGTKGQGLLGVVDHGPLLVLHLDELEGAVACHGVLGHHDADIVTVDAHAVVQELAVGDVSVRGVAVRVPGVAAHRVDNVGHVEAREDGHDARHLERLARVNGDDSPIADGGVQNLCLQARLWAQVVRELGATRDLVGGVHALDGTTDLLELFHTSLLLDRGLSPMRRKYYRPVCEHVRPFRERAKSPCVRTL